MQYKSLATISKIEAKALLNNSNTEIISETLFRIVYYIDDYEWVKKCIYDLKNNSELSKTIIVCIWDIARIHKIYDKDFIKLLSNYKKNPELKDFVNQTISDIKIFTKK